MVSEDRRLKLRGYQVFRFGGQEFADVRTAEALLDDFSVELSPVCGYSLKYPATLAPTPARGDRHTVVDVPDAPKTVTRTQRGVSDRSAQGYAQAAHAAS